ncbi:protein PIF-like [Mytilus californianus]|uniref:protein PIF-like n=1 Tax=Mytilus californianus TaxID=6549 RepID=UPI002247645C|nr:protein PIF-like [Mytilus californianus]
MEWYRCLVLIYSILFSIFSISNSAPGRFTRSLKCRSLLDLIVVVDGSDSITAKDFVTLKKSLADYQDALHLADDQAKFGLVLYSSDVSANISLSSNKQQLRKDILALRHPRDGTRTDLGIKAMREMFQKQGRKEVPKVGIVITDGISKDPEKTAKQSLITKTSGVTIFAVGVSQLIDKIELNSIASSADKVLSISTFDQLKSVVSTLVKEVCPTTTTSTTTTTTTTTITTTTTTPPPTTTTSTTTSTTTPATTTTMMTTTADWDPCDGCKMRNGAGFNGHPTDCGKFVQCYFGNAGIKAAVIQECPWGNFWSQESLTCQPAGMVKCPNDRCLVDQTLYTYESTSGNCRSFWACEGNQSYPMCCPVNYRYKKGIGCVPDETCKESCPPRQASFLASDKVVKERIPDADTINNKLEKMPVVKAVKKLLVCDKKPVKDDPDFFEQYVEFNGWVKMPCAPGTHFNAKDCHCTEMAVYNMTTGGCKSKVKLDFGKSFEEAKNPVYVVNQNVDVKNGIAKFDGKSLLRVPQLSNVDLGGTVVLRLRIKDTRRKKLDKRSTRPQAIVSNGDCGNNASLLVAKEEDAIIFGAQADGGQYTSFEIPTPGDDWKDIVYKYSDGKLEGEVNKVKYSKFLDGSGPIERRACALQIGHGEEMDDFEGEMDNIEMFTCMPDDER